MIITYMYSRAEGAREKFCLLFVKYAPQAKF